MSKTFLVTGGAGFIGTNLVEKLVALEHKVIVVDDLSAGDNRARLPESVIFHQVDVRDTDKLIALAQGVEVIIHLAALPRVQFSIDEPQVAHDVNVNGTLSVLEAARKAGVKRVILAATSAAYGDQEVLPLSTNLPVQPKSPYALHKYIGEEMLKLWHELYDLETVSLRFFNVYGPHFDPEGPYALVIGRFFKLKQAGLPLTITGDGTQTRDFVHVHDVVEALVKSALSTKVGKGEVLNVGSGSQTSINELAVLVGGEIEYIPPRIEPKFTLADITETKQMLGWEPTIDLVTGIAELKSQANLV